MRKRQQLNEAENKHQHAIRKKLRNDARVSDFSEPELHGNKNNIKANA
jgi:hypothetical protein